MNYVFHVREWNIDYFSQLEISIRNAEANSSFIWLTMFKSVINKLSNKNIYYLPELFEKEIITDENSKILDDYMFEKHNYGIQYIYETERFKPTAVEAERFINSHISVLMKLIPENSKLISLTCDHFVYIISGYINEFKGGENYYIQPIGFPQNAQIIMHNSRDLKYFRKKPFENNLLQEYIDSLPLDPKFSIHYMKPQKLPSLKHSMEERIKELTKEKTKDNIFTYLEPKGKNIIPGRFTIKKNINYKFDYYFEDDINKLTGTTRKIFYFPLQFEPEMSILAYSPWYKSQLEIIRLISQSLKKDDILLLKENPKMIGKREIKYYDEISKYQNVKWAHPDINSRKIIRSSFKVISITGTATIEAACMGVNSMIFGYPPFRDLLISEPVSNQPFK